MGNREGDPSFIYFPARAACTLNVPEYVYCRQWLQVLYAPLTCLEHAPARRRPRSWGLQTIKLPGRRQHTPVGETQIHPPSETNYPTYLS